jgi:hypothetical protein
MNTKRTSSFFLGSVVAALVLLAFTVASLRAASGPTTFTVTAVGKKNNPAPAMKKDDVQLYQGKERLQIADWRRGEKLYLAVLIDDSLDQTIANQWSDLKAFMNEQSPDTYIAVAYARNGTAMLAQDFTNNHELAAKALRIPLGDPGAFGSPYLSLGDFLKRWPAPQGERSSILLISSGTDYFRGGGFGLENPDNDTDIEHAQRQNVNVWTVYAPDNTHRFGRNFFRLNISQSLLSKLSGETGAESYFLGFGEPVTLKPYFDEINEHLKNQYLLTFQGPEGGSKGKFIGVRVRTEIPNAEFMYPSSVFVPGTK